MYVCMYIYGKKKQKNNLFKNKFFASYQCEIKNQEIKLQVEIQITQQHNESKLKNTCIINRKIVKAKIS